LIKMPKVYFVDTWLRNSFLNNFENIKERLDKGAFFENIVWREFGLVYGIDNIKYWRDQNKNEVDLVIRDQKAYEVKFSKNLIKPKKYTSFTEKYPTIPLRFITFEDFLEFMVKEIL
jgi:predicted AAA+ superfamily ATPase